MQATIEIKVSNGVKLSHKGKIDSFHDLGKFGAKLHGFVRNVRRLMPEIAGEKLSDIKLRIE